MLRRENTRDQGFKSDRSCHVVEGASGGGGAHEEGIQQHETPERRFPGSPLLCQENACLSISGGVSEAAGGHLVDIGRLPGGPPLGPQLMPGCCTARRPSGLLLRAGEEMVGSEGLQLLTVHMEFVPPGNSLLATQGWHQSCPQPFREAIILKRRTGVTG